jgi:hypothetical protein
MGAFYHMFCKSKTAGAGQLATAIEIPDITIFLGRSYPYILMNRWGICSLSENKYRVV